MNRDLFPGTTRSENLLPVDGFAQYYGVILSLEKADHYFQQLSHTINWQFDRARIMGKEIITKRKTAWYAERPYRYYYSGITRTALQWTKQLLALKALIEDETGECFNACLLNLYHNGSEGMAWHSDDEAQLQPHAAIASLSLGAERRFSFKHKVSRQTCSLKLEHGSLLLMKDETQVHWLHRLPPTKKVFGPRINLTFRRMADFSNEV